MAKKVIKRKKIKVFSVLLLVVILVCIYFLGKMVFSFKIQNIFITGTNYLSDKYIMSEAGIEDYPSYFKTFSFSLEKKLSNNAFINSVDVKKSFLGVVNIDITESKVLFFREYDKKYVLDNGSEVDSLVYDYSPIRVINFIPDTIYERFVREFSSLNDEIIEKISEIKYDPSEYDNNRFLLYMCDGNYIYVNLAKFSSMNYYNEIYPTLDEKKGILYLDSGNHFQEFK